MVGLTAALRAKVEVSLNGLLKLLFQFGWIPAFKMNRIPTVLNYTVEELSVAVVFDSCNITLYSIVSVMDALPSNVILPPIQISILVLSRTRSRVWQERHPSSSAMNSSERLVSVNADSSCNQKSKSTRLAHTAASGKHPHGHTNASSVGNRVARRRIGSPAHLWPRERCLVATKRNERKESPSLRSVRSFAANRLTHHRLRLRQDQYLSPTGHFETQRILSPCSRTSKSLMALYDANADADNVMQPHDTVPDEA